MSEHAIGNKERFKLLLQQLQLIEDAVVIHFENAQIERLLVEKKERKWHFQFLFEKILPFNVYLKFSTQLERSFSNIAAISYNIKVINQAVTPELLLEYWNYCIQQIDGISPPLVKLLNEQIPEVSGNKLTVSVRNEAEGLALKRKYGPVIGTIYQSFGFPLLAMDTEIKSEEKNEEYQQFLLAKQKEDQERAHMAVIEMQKKEADKSDTGGEVPSGPLTIGLT